jgi:hypothetical protein
VPFVVPLISSEKVSTILSTVPSLLESQVTIDETVGTAANATFPKGLKTEKSNVKTRVPEVAFLNFFKKRVFI